MKEYIKGKEIAGKVAEKLQSNFSALQKESGKNISLGVFLVGNDPVIESFVKIKKAFAEKVGVDFKVFRYDAQISELDFIESFLKEQKKVDGVITQLPLPATFNVEHVLQQVDIKKDVDLLSPQSWENFKNIDVISESDTLPPVAGAVWNIMQSVDLADEKKWQEKKILLIGYGKLVGEPVGVLFQKYGIDFDVLKKDMDNDVKEKLLAEADLIISGAGVPNLIQKEMIQEGVFLIDAGTSSAKKTLVGDINLGCLEKAKYFSKTPGGVGPITVAVLYENLFNLVKNNI